MANIVSYFKLTKPGIVMGNTITCAGGFMLASRGEIVWELFFLTLLGLSLIVAAGCVSNNYVDRAHDAKMERTKNRPLVKGEISSSMALGFAGFLMLAGSAVLFFGVNLLTLLLAWTGFVVYLIFYSFSKYRTVHATLIGSIAGATPPVVGYCAVHPHLDGGALILFLMIALWQMPHFYAIAVYRLEEYASASIPVLPIIKGMRTTKTHMVLYIVGFLAAALMLPLFRYVGTLYVVTMVLLSLVWLLVGMRGFKSANDKQWARKMFFCSLAVVMGACAIIPFSVV